MECDRSSVWKLYDSAPLVLRNYYYDDDKNRRSLYFPLGTGELGSLMALKGQRDYITKSLKKSSYRKFFCHFAGRMEYNNSNSDGEIERRELKAAMLASEQSNPADAQCNGRVSPINERLVAQHTLNTNEYINFMMETVFTPCPGGMNYETFRHYEVCVN